MECLTINYSEKNSFLSRGIEVTTEVYKRDQQIQKFQKIQLGGLKPKEKIFLPIGLQDVDKIIKDGFIYDGFVLYSKKTKKPFIVKDKNPNNMGKIVLFRISQGEKDNTIIRGAKTKVIMVDHFCLNLHKDISIKTVEILAIMYPNAILQVERGEKKNNVVDLVFNGEKFVTSVNSNKKARELLRITTNRYLRRNDE